MKKTLMIAATLLSLGVGSAFAGDGDPHAQPPARVPNASTLQNNAPSQRLFPATTRPQVNVYSSFNNGDFAQGGEQ